MQTRDNRRLGACHVLEVDYSSLMARLFSEAASVSLVADWAFFCWQRAQEIDQWFNDRYISDVLQTPSDIQGQVEILGGNEGVGGNHSPARTNTQQFRFSVFGRIERSRY